MAAGDETGFRAGRFVSGPTHVQSGGGVRQSILTPDPSLPLAVSAALLHETRAPFSCTAQR